MADGQKVEVVVKTISSKEPRRTMCQASLEPPRTATEEGGCKLRLSEDQRSFEFIKEGEK
jgi:hypothetical protein